MDQKSRGRARILEHRAYASHSKPILFNGLMARNLSEKLLKTSNFMAESNYCSARGLLGPIRRARECIRAPTARLIPARATPLEPASKQMRGLKARSIVWRERHDRPAFIEIMDRAFSSRIGRGRVFQGRCPWLGSDAPLALKTRCRNGHLLAPKPLNGMRLKRA